MDLCNINTIKSLLARHGFRFAKSLGQNFLCDPSVPPAIAESAGIASDVCVLEVGPGIGTLTRELCAGSRKVVAVELDRRLPAVLAETMRDFGNFTLVEGDILKTDIRALCKEHFGEQKAVACANLPYYITTPAIIALVDSGAFLSITVMVQREVARRICARPGTADYGAFTLYINYRASAQITLDVPRDSFIPAPKVDSSVVRLDILDAPPVAGDEKMIFRLIRAAFAQRRKTLLNCLHAAWPNISKDELADAIKSCGFVENVRGEQLSISDYARLSQVKPFNS